MAIKDFKIGNLWQYKGTDLNGKINKTKAGMLWYAMKHRCKPLGSEQLKQETYVGCTYSDNFSDFQYFANWCHNQVGYLEENYQLDKDILCEGNKFYSEDTCVFVPRNLNVFLCDSGKTRGSCPIGVYKTSCGKYMARCRKSGVSQYLGTFKNPYEAYEVYKNAKEMEAYNWFKRLDSSEFKVDSRVIERMRVWKLPAKHSE